MILKLVQVRLDPDIQQQQLLAKAFDSCPRLGNYCLNSIEQTYKQTRKNRHEYRVKKLISQLNKDRK
ncbi:helix-turn-helix domain-containing protein [Microcoleus sp.]|uniref:helix-turn-helix domain-containing protein n=1 Tax=Microcoleus sp. TaxID=44472 RepID=UPI003C726635